MQNLTKSVAAGHLTALFSVTIWGMTFISTKVLLQSLAPLEILFIRFTMAFLALWIISPKRLVLSDKKHELYFAAAGLLGVTLYFLGENVALTYTYASNVGLLVSVSPFFTALLTSVFLKEEKLHPSFFAGFFFAMAGVFMVSFNGSFVLKLNPFGDVLAILAAFSWAAYSVLLRKISSFGYNALLSTRRVFFYGVLFMFPAMPFMGFNPDIHMLFTAQNVLNLLFLGLIASAVCYVTWNFSLSILGPVRTSIYIYIIPAVTVIASAVLLHERITYVAGIGTLLIFIGLFISGGILKVPDLKKLKETANK